MMFYKSSKYRRQFWKSRQWSQCYGTIFDMFVIIIHVEMICSWGNKAVLLVFRFAKRNKMRRIAKPEHNFYLYRSQTSSNTWDITLCKKRTVYMSRFKNFSTIFNFVVDKYSFLINIYIQASNKYTDLFINDYSTNRLLLL